MWSWPGLAFALVGSWLRLLCFVSDTLLDLIFACPCVGNEMGLAMALHYFGSGPVLGLLWLWPCLGCALGLSMLLSGNVCGFIGALL